MAGRVSAKRDTANTGGREPEWSGQAVDPARHGLSHRSSSFQQQGEGCHGPAATIAGPTDATALIKGQLRRENRNPHLPLARLRLLRLVDLRRFYAALSREHFVIA